MDMVTAVTSFGRSGLSDWLIQRLSSVVLLAYTVFICWFLLTTPDLGYESWKALFEQTAVRVFSVAALLSVVVHAWIGLWSITTDYMTERMMGSRGNVLRWLAQLGGGLLLFTYLVWGIQVLWS
jgi:succinate dehydrogenase / fumarate reductase membrane anchor subunit